MFAVVVFDVGADDPAASFFGTSEVGTDIVLRTLEILLAGCMPFFLAVAGIKPTLLRGADRIF